MYLPSTINETCGKSTRHSMPHLSPCILKYLALPMNINELPETVRQTDSTHQSSINNFSHSVYTNNNVCTQYIWLAYIMRNLFVLF